jgi:predicted deacylase
MLHVRADMDDPRVARLANALASHVIIDTQGPAGTLRREATAAGTPTVTVEMGEAHRFQPAFIEPTLDGVRSVLAEFGVLETETVAWPGWRTVVDGTAEKTWLRADAGGMVDMHADLGTLVEAGESIATIADPFHAETVEVEAPFTALLVGILENPLVYPGNPLCHLVKLDADTQRAIERNGDG